MEVDCNGLIGQYNVAGIRVILAANRTPRDEYEPEEKRLDWFVLTRNMNTGRFNNDEDHFILDQDKDNTEMANCKGDIVTITKKDLFPIKGLIIRRPVEVWFLVHTSKLGVRKNIVNKYNSKHVK